MNSRLLSLLSLVPLLSCGIDSTMLVSSDEFEGDTTMAADDPTRSSDRGGFGSVSLELTTTPLVTLDPRKSMAVTDVAIVSKFSLQAVLNQLGQPTGQSGNALFRQLWDTQNPAPGQADLVGPHCTDANGTLNGFPYACRTVEGAQAQLTSPTNIASYSAIGLFNRFDLAATSGKNCGEYRIVFGKTGGGSGRAFIIFEAVLPNPRPSLGLEGCRPVVNFWRDLTNDASEASRGDKLHNFYFAGLPRFAPVVKADHYGAASLGGQVRVNMFIGGNWLLREFSTTRMCEVPAVPVACTNASTCPVAGSACLANLCAPCQVRILPATVKTNPFGALFSAASTDSRKTAFQTSFFPSQVASLATGTVNTFNYAVPDSFNAGGSDAQAFGGLDSYLTQISGNTVMRAAIQSELTKLGTSLTPENIVARAEALSCGGCHQRSAGANLGGGITFPNSAGFVHSSENQEPGPNGARFVLSSALTETLLPFRVSVMNQFLARVVDNSEFFSAPTAGRAADGSVTIAVTLKNIGTTVWTAADGFSLAVITSDAAAGSISIAPLPAADAIAEGQTKRFLVRFENPATTFAATVRMTHAGTAFGTSVKLTRTVP